MISCRGLAAIATVVFAAAAASAQATTLHGAWLREVLDLDHEGAAVAYQRLAADRGAATLDRLVATARAAELRQQGVGTALPPPDLEVVPEVLRQHFQQTLSQQQPVIERELEAAAGDRADLQRFFGSTEVPQLRPLVLATVLAAAEQANPSAVERQRQQRLRFPPWSNDPARVLDRIRANEIVRAELDGQPDAAATLRRRVFPNWRPQPWPEDAAAAWSRVRENLVAWQRERQLTSSELELLRRLQERLVEAAEARPQVALQLLDRMPLYAERLRVGVTERR